MNIKLESIRFELFQLNLKRFIVHICIVYPSIFLSLIHEYITNDLFWTMKSREKYIMESKTLRRNITSQETKNCLSENTIIPIEKNIYFPWSYPIRGISWYIITSWRFSIYPQVTCPIYLFVYISVVNV